ncbi:MAG: hypothetical protein MJ192_04760 [Clostridia bacterium]|nr:hypothetical protein [Clostridia bacterium]
MKRSFSSQQKALIGVVIWVTVFCVPFLWLIFLLSGEGIGVALCLLTIALCLPALLISIRWGFIFSSVHLDDTGLEIRSKRGKVRRALRWDDVRLFTLTEKEQDGERYLCLSSKADLDLLRTTFGGVIFTIFYEDKTTIVLPYDAELLDFCEDRLEDRGVPLRLVTNPNTGK